MMSLKAPEQSACEVAGTCVMSGPRQPQTASRSLRAHIQTRRASSTPQLGYAGRCLQYGTAEPRAVQMQGWNEEPEADQQMNG